MSAERITTLQRQGVNVAAASRATKPVTVVWADQDVHLTYYTRAMKLADTIARLEMTTDLERVKYAITMITQAVATWDLTDDDGPLPITREVIVALPEDLVAAISQALLSAGAPGEVTGSN